MTADAFLLVSYGSPESREEVVPFLENLFAGKPVPPERIARAAEKYDQCVRQTGRYSPLNEECRSLLSGILREFRERTEPPEKLFKVYWGNLFWHPLLEDTVAAMTQDGVQHALCFATSAFDSQAGNRRYADALDAARNRVRQKLGTEPPILEKPPLPFEHPLFLEAQADTLLRAMASATLELEIRLNGVPVGGKTRREATNPVDRILVLFSAHSIPQSDAEKSPYVSQLLRTCRRVVELCGPFPFELVFQSRSGGSTERWLEPDIRDRVREIGASKEYAAIVVSPIGFFCENMETLYDLDCEIGEICNASGLLFFRAGAVGAAPKICRMIREIVVSQRANSAC